MIISHSKKFIYFKVPKTASSSVEEALSTICDPHMDTITADNHRDGINDKIGDNKLVNHDGLYRLFKLGVMNKSRFDEFRRIATVRNPWDRLVSEFWYVMVDIQNRYDDPSEKEVMRDFDQYVIDKLGTSRDRDFQSDVMADFYYDDQGFFVDNVIRFESLQDDFDELCDEMNVDKMKLPRLKTNQRMLDSHFTEYYNYETRILVHATYMPIIDRFGYECSS